MKEARLGILGGMGPQATQDFYQRILDRTDAACDQEHLPTLILSDTGMPDRTAAILGGDAEGCYRRLLAGAQLLERGGCTLLAVPVGRLARAGKKKVGILGTDGTIQAGVYQRECDAQGLEAASPPPEVQRLVMRIIYEEIKRGEKGSREKFAVIDRWLRESGCDGGILACTELSVYRTYHGLPDYYTDAMDVLAETCILACGYKLRTV